MIVRILDEGQYDLPDGAIDALDDLDGKLNAAIEAGDEGAFADALSALLAAVRTTGSPLDAATIVPSDLTLPHEGASLEDVRQLLDSESDLAEPAPEGI